MNVYLVHISKNNLEHEKQIILWMIPNGEGWYYLEVKKLSALLRGTTSKPVGDFFVWIVFIDLEQITNLNLLKKYVKIKILLVPQCLMKILRY